MVKEINVKEEKINIKEYFGKGWLDVVAIIELVGKPVEHVKEVMDKTIEGLNKEEGIKLLSNNIHKPKEVEKAPGVFSTFAELEFLANSFSRVMEFVIDYMPSSIEIVAPTDMSIKLNEANSTLNDLVARVYKYETLLKALTMQSIELQRELQKYKKDEESDKEQEKRESSEKESKKHEDECSCEECKKEHKEKKHKKKKE